MRHRTLLERTDDGGFVAHDPDVPWLKPSRGRTAEEAIAAFENRLRYVDVERRKSFASRKFAWPVLFMRLTWELFRALGLFLMIDKERKRPRLLRLAVIMFVIVPLALFVLAMVKS